MQLIFTRFHLLGLDLLVSNKIFAAGLTLGFVLALECVSGSMRCMRHWCHLMLHSHIQFCVLLWTWQLWQTIAL